MLRDPETTALLTQGTMNVADKGKETAVTTLRQTVKQQTAKEMLTCVQACRHLPAYDRHGKEPRWRLVFASEGQDRIQVEESPEPYLPLPCGVNSDGHAVMARNAQTEVNQACPPPLRGELLRHAVRRGPMARQWLDELPKLEKEKKEDVAKLMALTI